MPLIWGPIHLGDPLWTSEFLLILVRTAFQSNQVLSYFQLVQIRLPDPLQEVLSVFLGEVAQVGDKGCDQQDISTQRAVLPFEVLHGFSPSHVLRGKSPDLQFPKSN